MPEVRTDQTGETVSINPATGEVIGRFTVDSPEMVRQAVEKARQIQPLWAATDFRAMGNILFANKRSYIDRVPFGVVGIISPWNYPFGIPFHEVILALMSGNAVVLKVASQSQLVGRRIQECVSAGGVPEGLFTLVNIRGPLAGDAFINAGIDKLFFTGSVAVGKTLMAAASRRLVPVSLELGGNDPMIVCEDADLERAVAGAVWAGYSNAGQSCGGVERIYVERRIYEPFVALLRTRVAALRTGSDTDFSVDIGAITTAKQLQTITAHVNDALQKGAVATATGRSNAGGSNGTFYRPVVLERVDDSMITMREETFGPVVAVMPVDSIDEAVTRANDSDLGLTASVWTRNRRKGHRIASRLQAGAVTINDHLMSHGLAETPWGGFKNSGIGRTHGSIGFEEMTQPRVVVDDIMPLVKRNMWWHPHSKQVYDGLLGALHVLYGHGPRLRGLWRLMRVFARTFYCEK
ncbi:MAG: succinate-semialdehyde dehydrogenase [Bacteroidetes bacterium]|nr:succinate-semialdehyde dehydrogenase [Bacteroidota bacterium]